MKKQLLSLCLILCFSWQNGLAQDPKHEFRATWFTTVENIDWHSVNNQGVLHEGAKDEESAFLRYSEVATAIEAAPVAQADLSHVKLIEAEHCSGPYRMDKVILFNINRISQEEAAWYAEAGEYNENVLCIPKKQWLALFRDGEEG